ncbi:hypothetical protein LJC00_01160 [Dysgonomonas sp. OttesenSCG-928-M03]|nr:hypothetical protein [Dysgonomonas sp. OttesenSCG-928-M03]
MNEKFTQVQSGEKLEKDKTPVKGASSKTLSFLKMFARSYSAESSLSVATNTICVN